MEDLIVEKDAASELQCRICFEILDTPRQCRNGHLFCLECISGLFALSSESESKCPTCRCAISEETLARNMFVERAISKLKVWCPFRFKHASSSLVDEREGCKEQVSFSELHQHRLECSSRFVDCPNSLICPKIRFSSLHEHISSCPFRPVSCEHCDQQFVCNTLEVSVLQKKNYFPSFNHFFIKEHNKRCTEFPMVCEFCGEESRRSQLEVHVRERCVEVSIPCEFEKQGCNEIVKRSQIEKHINENVGRHMNLMKSFCDHHISDLVKNFEKILSKKEETIRKLEVKINTIEENLYGLDTLFIPFF